MTEQTKKRCIKTSLITGGVIVGIILVFLFWGIGVNNRAISLEERVREADVNITSRMNTRDLQLHQLVQTLENYTGVHQAQFEAAIEMLTAAMAAGGYDLGPSLNVIAALPNIVDVAAWDTLSITIVASANQVHSAHQDFNQAIMRYNTHFRRFPNSMLLSIAGQTRYDFQQRPAPQLVVLNHGNLFGN
ncbi:MAG: LemA family protein [Firmicutes bacterium]|nr:LemA family protein [Bacillota bacterium]